MNRQYGMTPITMPCQKIHILIYTKNGHGFVHTNIAVCVKSIEGICASNRWTCEISDDPKLFTAEKIDTFDCLVFANTNNEIFENDDQRTVFQTYMRNGGGFVGIHSTCCSERRWPWFWANLGGKFFRHPKLQPFDIQVIDDRHLSTQHLPAVWTWEDEFYLLNSLNPDIHVLLAGDVSTLKNNAINESQDVMLGGYFPLAWCHEFEGGYQWVTALGHKAEHYQDLDLVKHIEGGIRWAVRSDGSGLKTEDRG